MSFGPKLHTRDYHFEVSTLEAGQRRRYGDSYYHYEIEDKSEEYPCSQDIVMKFCLNVVRPALGKKSEKDWFASYMTKFEKVDDRKYVYKVTSPSTH